MEDKNYEIDKMLNTLIDLAKEEVDKAKQRGYFGKDIVEPATMVIALAKEASGKGGYNPYGYGTYGNRRNDYPGYGNYGYGTHEEFGNDEYGTGNIRGRQGGGYGRTNERYG